MPLAVPGQDELVHIRPVDATTANLLLDGLQRSPALRMLADRVEASDVIVICSLVSSLRGRHGALVWMSASDDARYVRAAVLRGLESDATISTFGHEFQHAIELIDAPWVTNLHRFEALYRQIGTRETVGPGSYDTEAARTAGRAVMRELKARPSVDVATFIGPLKASDWATEYQRLREVEAR